MVVSVVNLLSTVTLVIGIIAFMRNYNKTQRETGAKEQAITDAVNALTVGMKEVCTELKSVYNVVLQMKTEHKLNHPNSNIN